MVSCVDVGVGIGISVGMATSNVAVGPSIIPQGSPFVDGQRPRPCPNIQIFSISI
jgi:hypothetical protein